MNDTELKVGDLVEIVKFVSEPKIAVVSGYKRYAWGTAICIVTTDGKGYIKDSFELRKL